MKLTLKKFAFVLSLGLGLGVSASVSAGSVDCKTLALKCESGNAYACQLWDINCYSYEG